MQSGACQHMKPPSQPYLGRAMPAHKNSQALLCVCGPCCALHGPVWAVPIHRALFVSSLSHDLFLASSSPSQPANPSASHYPKHNPINNTANTNLSSSPTHHLFQSPPLTSMSTNVNAVWHFIGLRKESTSWCLWHCLSNWLGQKMAPSINLHKHIIHIHTNPTPTPNSHWWNQGGAGGGHGPSKISENPVSFEMTVWGKFKKNKTTGSTARFRPKHDHSTLLKRAPQELQNSLPPRWGMWRFDLKSTWYWWWVFLLSHVQWLLKVHHNKLDDHLNADELP